jgi:hypothetical protein
MGIRRRGHAAIVVVLATCLLAGCATRMSEQELNTSLNTIKPVPARRAIRRVVPIYAQTPMEAWVVRTEAKSTPESSSLSRQLASGFALGRIRQVDYIIGGPYPKLSDRLVLNGLKMNEGHELPGLRIVLVSSASPTRDLLQAAKAMRVRLEHRALH